MIELLSHDVGTQLHMLGKLLELDHTTQSRDRVGSVSAIGFVQMNLLSLMQLARQVLRQLASVPPFFAAVNDFLRSHPAILDTACTFLLIETK